MREVSLDIGVWKAAPGQMNEQLRRSDRAERKEHADAFENDLMFRHDKGVGEAGIQQLRALLVRGRLIA